MMGRQWGFVRSGGGPGEVRGFPWRSLEIRRGQGGQSRSGQVRRVQERSGESMEVRGCQGRLWNLWEVRGVQGSQMEVNGHQEGPGRSGMSLGKKENQGLFKSG